MIDNWEDAEKEYNRICIMPTRPSSDFRKVKDGDIIDEDMSVKWNREEVKKLQEEYRAETLRLRREQNAAFTSVLDDIYGLISEDTGLSKEKAKIVWDFVYEKYHAYGEMFQQIDEYIVLINNILEK